MKKISIIFSLLLLFIFCFTGLTYAESKYNPLPSQYDTKPCHYFIYYKDGVLYLSVIENTSDYPNALDTGRAFVGGSGVIRYENMDSNGGFKVLNFKASGVYWQQLNSSTKSPGEYFSFSYDSIDTLESNINVYRSRDNDAIFFSPTPIPSTPTVEEMIAVEVPIMAQEVKQTMKIILLCGVGCLAFLVCLVILPKVLYRFL